RGMPQALLAAAAKALDDVAFPLTHDLHVHGDGPDSDPIVIRAPCEVSDPRARHHGLGRGTANIDASAADMLALDERSPPPRIAQRNRQWTAALARADHDRIVVLGLFAHAGSHV